MVSSSATAAFSVRGTLIAPIELGGHHSAVNSVSSNLRTSALSLVVGVSARCGDPEKRSATPRVAVDRRVLAPAAPRLRR